MKAVVVLVVIIALTQAKVSWPVENCGSAKDLTLIKQGFLNAKPTKGSTSEITLVGDIGDHLEFKEVTLTAKLNGVTMQVLHNAYKSVFDQGDPITYVYNNEIPGFTPSGNYVVQFEFQDKNKGRVGCAAIKFSL